MAGVDEMQRRMVVVLFVRECCICKHFNAQVHFLVTPGDSFLHIRICTFSKCMCSFINKVFRESHENLLRPSVT
jgi:hypothetical protein